MAVVCCYQSGFGYSLLDESVCEASGGQTVDFSYCDSGPAPPTPSSGFDPVQCTAQALSKDNHLCCVHSPFCDYIICNDLKQWGSPCLEEAHDKQKCRPDDLDGEDKYCGDRKNKKGPCSKCAPPQGEIPEHDTETSISSGQGNLPGMDNAAGGMFGAGPLSDIPAGEGPERCPGCFARTNIHCEQCEADQEAPYTAYPYNSTCDLGSTSVLALEFIKPSPSWEFCPDQTCPENDNNWRTGWTGVPMTDCSNCPEGSILAPSPPPDINYPNGCTFAELQDMHEVHCEGEGGGAESMGISLNEPLLLSNIARLEEEFMDLKGFEKTVGEELPKVNGRIELGDGACHEWFGIVRWSGGYTGWDAGPILQWEQGGYTDGDGLPWRQGDSHEENCWYIYPDLGQGQIMPHITTGNMAVGNYMYTGTHSNGAHEYTSHSMTYTYTDWQGGPHTINRPEMKLVVESVPAGAPFALGPDYHVYVWKENGVNKLYSGPIDWSDPGGQAHFKYPCQGCQSGGAPGSWFDYATHEAITSSGPECTEGKLPSACYPHLVPGWSSPPPSSVDPSWGVLDFLRLSLSLCMMDICDPCEPSCRPECPVPVLPRCGDILYLHHAAPNTGCDKIMFDGNQGGEQTASGYGNVQCRWHFRRDLPKTHLNTSNEQDGSKAYWQRVYNSTDEISDDAAQEYLEDELDPDDWGEATGNPGDDFPGCMSEECLTYSTGDPDMEGGTSEHHDPSPPPKPSVSLDDVKDFMLENCVGECEKDANDSKKYTVPRDKANPDIDGFKNPACAKRDISKDAYDVAKYTFDECELVKEQSTRDCDTDGPYGPMNYEAVVTFFMNQFWHVQVHRSWTYEDMMTEELFARLVANGLPNGKKLTTSAGREITGGTVYKPMAGDEVVTKEEVIMERSIYFEGLFFNGHLDPEAAPRIKNSDCELDTDTKPPAIEMLPGEGEDPETYIFDCGDCPELTNITDFGECVVGAKCGEEGIANGWGAGVNCYTIGESEDKSSHIIPTKKVAKGGNLRLSFCRGPCTNWWEQKNGSMGGAGANLCSENKECDDFEYACPGAESEQWIWDELTESGWRGFGSGLTAYKYLSYFENANFDVGGFVKRPNFVRTPDYLKRWGSADGGNPLGPD